MHLFFSDHLLGVFTSSKHIHNKMLLFYNKLQLLLLYFKMFSCQNVEGPLINEP